MLPNHPNNTGAKPMLIGLEEQVKAQSQYIYRGNYGLVSMEEIMATGISKDFAKEMMRLKLKFAFEKIRDTEELIDIRVIGNRAVELRDGVFIYRKSSNIYEFLFNRQSVTVDLNKAGSVPIAGHQEHR